MKQPVTCPDSMSNPSQAARDSLKQSGRRCFVSDWKQVVMFHFAVDPEAIQPEIPLPLDLLDGRAVVTLVSFRMERMRFFRGGLATGWLTAPIASHHFLNLRTYVLSAVGPAIFFQREWLDNRLAVMIGPHTFGLPYRNARISYRQNPELTSSEMSLSGEVATRQGTFTYRARTNGVRKVAEPGSDDEFLLERYTATCADRGVLRHFQVWHPAWQMRPLSDCEFADTSLIDHVGRLWWTQAEFLGGHDCSDLSDVWMGRPWRA
jgi:uncharacterized protein